MPRSKNRNRFGPAVETLEERLALSAAPAGETLTVLTEFTAAYPSRIGQANYNPAVDVNHNGIVGQNDGRLLLRSLPAIGPKTPMILRVSVSAADAARGSHGKNSGGATHNQDPTVIGQTTPGALIFTGTGTTDILLKGPATVADAQGRFAITLKLSDGINQFDLQAADRYGRQTLRAFPILWLDFAQYENAHPQKK